MKSELKPVFRRWTGPRRRGRFGVVDFNQRGTGDRKIDPSDAGLPLFGDKGTRILYVSGEESLKQLKLRSERIGINSDRLYVMAETDIDEILLASEKLSPTS